MSASRTCLPGVVPGGAINCSPGGHPVKLRGTFVNSPKTSPHLGIAVWVGTKVDLWEGSCPLGGIPRGQTPGTIILPQDFHKVEERQDFWQVKSLG